MLIVDEPTSLLDVLSAFEVIENIKTLADVSVLVITHDIFEAQKIADRIVVLRQGKICEQAPTDTIFENPKEEYTKAIIRSYAKIPRINQAGSETIVPDPILKINNLSKRYGSTSILQNISFEVHRNEIFGIIGESSLPKYR